MDGKEGVADHIYMPAIIDQVEEDGSPVRNHSRICPAAECHSCGSWMIYVFCWPRENEMCGKVKNME